MGGWPLLLRLQYVTGLLTANCAAALVGILTRRARLRIAAAAESRGLSCGCPYVPLLVS